ncbi:methyltransferase domain-containing protein [Actinomadura fulvescens]|uniref:Methyltransferase domain-containing protein n=1 Tax=Actinomadura fulvescens TaxID=46160 RepID=A0ABP6CFW9_9ACTN
MDPEQAQRRDDPFGRQMLDYLEDCHTWEIIERDDGHVSLGSGPARFFAPYDEWCQAEREAIKLAHGRVVDIGCGAGRHSLYLQAQGIDVMGIDASPGAVEVCEIRGLREVRQLSLEGLDDRFGRFDTALLLGLSSGYLGTPKGVVASLQRLHTLTTQSGVILLGNGGADDVMDDESSRAYLRRNINAGRYAGYRRMRIRYRGHTTEWFDFLRLTLPEVEELLSETGWEIDRLFQERASYYVCALRKRGPNGNR